MIREIMVSGDRRHGKTDLLLLSAVRDAREGKTVVWECRGAVIADHTQRHLIRDVLHPLDRHAAVNRNGNRMVFLPSAGESRRAGQIVFVGDPVRYGYRGHVDTYILDDTDRPTDELLAYYPKITAVYRSHCTGDGR